MARPIDPIAEQAAREADELSTMEEAYAQACKDLGSAREAVGIIPETEPMWPRFVELVQDAGNLLTLAAAARRLFSTPPTEDQLDLAFGATGMAVEKLGAAHAVALQALQDQTSGQTDREVH